MTKSEVYEVLKRLLGDNDPTSDMAKDIRLLKDELDEREGMLEKYRKESDDDNNDWKRKYYDLKKEYVDRFFGIIDESKEDKDDSKTEEIEINEIKIDDLFERS